MDLLEVNKALGGMDPADVALGAGLVGALAALIMVGTVVWFFISAIGYFKMFKKAGQRGWFAFIPVLREYALFRMSWTMQAFAVNIVLLGIFQIAEEADGVLAGIAVLAGGIAFIVIQAKLMLRVAKSFGKGTGWALLLFFVPFVATMILGFGNAEYQGNPAEKKAEA